ncbi:MAG: cytochrome c [Bacteroidetes bacterium]|nr:cytochrome c [Bacteroidota bacterium]
MLNLKNIFYTCVAATALYSCTSKGDNPGIEYAPDMYVSKAYEPFSQEKHMDLNPNGMTMRLPVAGTIARGQLDYIFNYPNTPEGYEASAAAVNPVSKTEENLMEGEKLYNIYCSLCHGKTGGNDGSVITVGNFARPSFANYQDPYIQNLPEGKIFFVITNGKNMMGAHGHMLTPHQRWQVVNYVKKLSLGDNFKTQNENNTIANTDSTTINN